MVVGNHWIRVLGLIGLFVVVAVVKVESFSPHSQQGTRSSNSRDNLLLHAHRDNDPVISRRWVLQNAFWGFASAALMTAASPTDAMAAEDIRGIPLTPFNGLIFNYKGSDFAGLDASTLNEPSIPYQEFVQKLKGGQVAFVEFLAPYGDVAYVTFKDAGAKPIRIGEGYPIEQHDGWSSPAFAIRTVVNEGVPYKFTVPGLAKFKL
jgi:hypothetical protein